MVAEKPRAGAAAELTKRVTELLNGCLGAMPFPSKALAPLGSTLIPDPPYWKALAVGLIYALFFCALPWVVVERPARFLLWLSIYGSLYAAWATWIARTTSDKVLRIIKLRLIPELSLETASRIDDDLARHFSAAGLACWSWIAAILGAVAAGFALNHDVPNVPYQVAWASVGLLCLFVTAARSTNVARFYYFFAKHLDDEANIYVFDPAHSTLVRSISVVGQHMLVFWFGILVSIALLIPFVSLGAPQEGPKFWILSHSLFASLVVPITSVFSIPFGTVVFLRSENAIRRAVDKVFHATLRSTERDIADLLARRQGLDESRRKRVSELRSLHKDLTAAGSYRSFLASGLSVLIPLIGTITALLKSFGNLK